MKPTLTHMSRSDIKRMLKNKELPNNALIISINDTDAEENEIVSLWEDYQSYRTRGAYISNMETYIFKDDEESFSELQANCIVEDVEFAKNYSKNIVVHCFAGVSRSAAVAKWINDYLEFDLEKYNSYTQHNKHVYDTLCKVSGVYNINNYYREMQSGGINEN